MSRIRYDDVSWERMIGAVQKVRQRLLRPRMFRRAKRPPPSEFSRWSPSCG